MVAIKKSLQIFFIVYLFSVPHLLASNIILNNENSSIPLGKHIQFLEDKKKSISIKELLSNNFQSTFQQKQGEVIFLGLADTRYWLKILNIQNLSDKKEWYITHNNFLINIIDSLSFYFVQDNQVVHQVNIPNFKEYLLQKQFPFIAVSIPAQLLTNKGVDVYIRADTRGNTVFSFSLSHSEITQKDYSYKSFIDIFIGIMLSLFLLNLFIFIQLREKIYLIYLAYLLLSTINIALTQSLEIFWGFHSSYTYKIAIGPFIILTLIGYIYYFLDIKNNFPKATYLLIFFVIASILSFVVILIDSLIGYRIISLLSISLVIAALYIGIVCYNRNCRQARLFIVGWSFYMLFIIVFFIYANDILTLHSFFVNAFTIGIVVEATFFSFALADRFFLLKLQIEEINRRLKKASEEIIRAFGMTVEKKDPYTAGHQFRVSKLAEAIAIEMKLDENYTENVKLSALIHDIGKIGIDSHLLIKKERLKQEEFEKIQQHVQIGHQIIENLDIPQEIKQGVLHHHERTDGSGYPQGLDFKKISIVGKIIAVADTVEAMVNARPYRTALGVKQALETIETEKGKGYDKEIVDACQEVFKKGFSFP